MRYDNETFAIFIYNKFNVPTVPRVISMRVGENSNEIKISDPYGRINDFFVATNDFYATRSITIGAHPHGVFTEKLDKLLLECHQHGFLIEQQDLPSMKSSDEPQVLTMKMLEAGFVLWMCSICVACVAFICEHVVRYNSDRRKMAREFPDTNTFYSQLMKSCEL